MSDISEAGRRFDIGELERLRYEAALLYGLVAALWAVGLQSAFAFLDATLPHQDRAVHSYASMPETTL